MSKCKKVQNPCKICLQSVNAKTGIQCQGACEAWAHFACLNYTPGRINDILRNQITVTCPCPDCKTSVPKEFQTKSPYTCNNIGCPANHPPACDGPDCQANTASKGKPIPPAPPGTLTQCGAECQEYSGCRKYVASTMSALRMKEEKEKQLIEKTRIRQERIRLESMTKGLSEKYGSARSAGGPGQYAGGGPMGPEGMIEGGSKARGPQFSAGGHHRVGGKEGWPEDCPTPEDAECGVEELIGTIGQLSEQINELMKHLKCAGNKDSCKNLTDKCAELSVALCCASRMYARCSTPDLARRRERHEVYTVRTSSSHASFGPALGPLHQAQLRQLSLLHASCTTATEQLQAEYRQADYFNGCSSNHTNNTVNENRSCFCPSNPGPK